MRLISLEVPSSSIDIGKLGRGYGAKEGIHITSFGSYFCDDIGGRIIGHHDEYDGPPLRYSNGKTIEEDRAGGNVNWRSDANELIRSRIQKLNKKKVAFLATMTNTAPSVKDNHDGAFELLGMLADGLEGNGVIVAHPKIESMIRKRYGNKLEYVSSVIRWYNRPECGMGSYRYLFNKFDKVVIKPEHVLTPDGKVDTSFFNSIGEAGREKAVVMLNYPCQRDCKSAKEHFRLISENAKSYNAYSGIDKNRWICQHTQELMIDTEKTQELKEIGISNFKLGRNKHAIPTAESVFPQLDLFQE